jgi:hypothetical protein
LPQYLVFHLLLSRRAWVVVLLGLVAVALGSRYSPVVARRALGAASAALLLSAFAEYYNKKGRVFVSYALSMYGLRSLSPVDRSRAATYLGWIGSPRAVGPLLATLKDADGHVRGDAANALGRIGNSSAVEPLIATLQDRDIYARLLAADALARIGDPRAVEPVRQLVRNANEYEIPTYEAALAALVGGNRADQHPGMAGRPNGGPFH